MQSEKLSLKMKLGFGAGDIFGGGSLMIIGIFYLFFLTDVLLISPALAGTVFLISKGWDAVSDPIMGIISDRTRTRFGRRRPYFLLGILLIFFSFFLMWYPVGFEKEIHRFIFILAAYIFFSTSYTITMIPYFALASELTTDYNERTSLTSYRMIFSMSSSLTCAVIPLPIVNYVKGIADVRTGYIVMALIFGLLFSLPFLATFLTTRERKEFQKEPEPFNIRKTFIEPYKTPTFVNVLFMYLFSLMTLDIIMSIIRYFITYYLKRDGETTAILGTLLVTQLLLIPFIAYSGKKFGKRKTFLYSLIYLILLMAMSFLIKPESPWIFVYIFAAFVGIASGGIYVMIYSIMPDVPDVDELYSGKRQEGIYSGLMTFMRKLGSALGIFIVSIIIEFAGYQKPIAKIVNGKTEIIKQAQTPEFFMILKIVFAIVPLAFLTLALYNTIRYRLTPDVHNRLNAFLTAKRKGDSYSEKEEEDLKNILK